MKTTVVGAWWKFTCVACGAKCEAEVDDVTDRPNIDCDGDRVGYYPVVKCGRCGMEHDVPGYLVTDKIREIAKKKRRKKTES